MDPGIAHEFNDLISSGTFEKAKREPDFLKKATGLFLLQDLAVEALEQDEAAIDAAEEKAVAELGLSSFMHSAAIGGGITAGVTLGLFLAGTIVAPFGILAILGTLATAAMATVCGGIHWSITKSRIEEDMNAERIKLDARFGALYRAIDGEVKEMDNVLSAQSPQVRQEFRSAFEHAALKRNLREERLHRQRVEEEAEATRQAAEQASTMATVAAVNASLASMRR